MLAFFRALNPVGKIGVIMGLLGGLAGAIVAIIVAPLIGTIFVLIFVAVFYFAFRAALGPMAKREKLRKSGAQAEATILEVTDTGMTINEIYPVIKLRLEVRPPNGQPYQVETKELINRMDIPQFQPGAVVPVMYDPKDPKKVSVGTVEGLVNADTIAQDPEKAHQAEEFLTKEDQKNQAILASGKPAKAMILNAWDLGVFVNGNNPAKTFLLEVRPEGLPAFQAQTTGVVTEASVPKYMPGKEIYVKYDPSDNTRVSIDHS
jgi:Protein of unknown function (DUF3592)